MREARFLIALAAVAIAALFGCTASQTSSPIMPNGSAQNPGLRNPEAVLGALQPPHARVPRDLYIADLGTGVVDILRNGTYRELGVISNGILNPNDAFLDTRGNLYVANGGGSSGGADVAEYAPGNTVSPSFVYSTGMASPEAVATDTHGSVFEADTTNDSVNEYFQGSNHLAATCSPGGRVLGVAVDSSGDVFVSAFNPSSGSFLAEYAGSSGGLGNCTEQVLGAPVLAGGIAVDVNKNLLAANGNEVAVIAPPYASVTGMIAPGFGSAINVHLNRNNTLAFVTDIGYHTVWVVTYPGGTEVMKLGASNGLDRPWAAVDWPNAVY